MRLKSYQKITKRVDVIGTMNACDKFLGLSLNLSIQLYK